MSRKLTFLAMTSALALGACVNTPNAFPTGYVYHNDVYKSPTPQESFDVTDTQRASMGPRQAEQFRIALYDLVQNLTDRAGLPPKPIYVMPHQPMNVFYAQVDNDLREAMRHTGYTLATAEEDAYHFTYQAYSLNKLLLDQKRYPNEVMESGNNVEIVLQVYDSDGADKIMLTEQRGFYHIDGADEYFSVLPHFHMNNNRNDE